MTLADRYGGAALVTGASAGIGEAFASVLAARGMDMILVARREERLRSLAVRLEGQHGVRCLVVPQDLAEPSAADAIHSAVATAGVPVGLLVNNAGFGTYGPFQAQDAEHQAAMVDLNCRAPLLLTHAFLPAMLERARGAIIFVASIAGYQPTPFLSVYGATKAFDLMLAEALWAELRPHGIDVLALSPGLTRTEFQQVAGTEHMTRHGRGDAPESVVEAALAALGRSPSVVPGARNKLLTFGSRWVPRSAVAGIARRINDPAVRGGGTSRDE